MSIERSIIARSRPYIINQHLMTLIGDEITKGCRPEIYQQPVRLEPDYLSPAQWSDSDIINPVANNVSSPRINELVRVNCLISRDHNLKWYRAERFLKQLQSINYCIGFEIIGNGEQITFRYLIHKSDLAIVKVSFNGEYPACAITDEQYRNDYRGNIYFQDWFCKPPYHHLFTCFPELLSSPFEPFIYALDHLPVAVIGFVQVLFQPVRNNWHTNVELLTDMEYLSKTLSDAQLPFRVQQQVPSGDIKQMAQEVESKAHNDKPFYFAALRTGVCSENNIDHQALVSFVNLFQHGGKPLLALTKKDYLKSLNPTQIKEMFRWGLVYRHGFLMNSAELAGLVHLPTIEEFKDRGLPIELHETLRIYQKDQLQSGLEIGSGFVGNQRRSIRIDDTHRRVSTHLIGRPGTGKTTTMEHMILQDIDAGYGLAFIDPHGDSVKRVLHLIPEENIQDTIYLDFGDPDWVPLWNPLTQLPGQNPGRTTDDLVAAIKSIVFRHAWGDRLEHLLRNGFYGLLHLPGASFLELLKLFEPGPKKNNPEKIRLVRRIIDAVDNEVVRIFWQRDFGTYRREDLIPPLHKLSKLLSSDETLSLMLTQPENKLDFTKIMDSGKILLLDLSNLGPDTRRIIGCFLLSFLYSTLLARNKKDPDNRRLFNIFCDEAHKLTTDALEDILAEARKFGVSLTLAHQYLSQFNQSQRDALSSVGSTIIFNVDINDARYLIKDLQGKVEPKDLATLETGEAIARIGTKVIKIKTPLPKTIPVRNSSAEIIRRSRKTYCLPANQICAMVKDGKYGTKKRSDIGYSGAIVNGISNLDSATFTYDEFE
ncbi:MAG: ATP-binding protein [Candidatus Marinimicrobia bacterium]|nr:ATP-binding protein [Candidatus Neomarinimicrobiota bacterium]